jgi:hypothetical protein
MKQKLLTETPVCPRERLVIISYTTSLSFALERIGSLAAIIITVFYLLALYLLALPNTPENPFASIYSQSLIKTTCQYLLSLLGSTLLFIVSTTIHPLYLWVISDLELHLELLGLPLGEIWCWWVWWLADVSSAPSPGLVPSWSCGHCPAMPRWYLLGAE